MRLTRNALTVEQLIWMVGDSAYDTLDWHDPYGQQGSCQSLRTILEAPMTHSISNTGSKTASTHTARTCS